MHYHVEVPCTAADTPEAVRRIGEGLGPGPDLWLNLRTQCIQALSDAA